LEAKMSSKLIRKKEHIQVNGGERVGERRDRQWRVNLSMILMQRKRKYLRQASMQACTPGSSHSPRPRHHQLRHTHSFFKYEEHRGRQRAPKPPFQQGFRGSKVRRESKCENLGRQRTPAPPIQRGRRGLKVRMNNTKRLVTVGCGTHEKNLNGTLGIKKGPRKMVGSSPPPPQRACWQPV
jgi:hypothetical protein